MVTFLSETDKRVTVVLDDAGIYAVYLVCTHRGCTPNDVTDATMGSGVSSAVAEARGVRAADQRLSDAGMPLPRQP